ncbi:hypothetical protein ACGFX4_09665 [Kitasatospora sp. NPDC048365]|uniref:hypothetical protein n=1 Tax=Kitasatospora sp. NPDC048365 TaxID=3364050 RepID=UPI00372168A4
MTVQIRLVLLDLWEGERRLAEELTELATRTDGGHGLAGEAAELAEVSRGHAGWIARLTEPPPPTAAGTRRRHPPGRGPGPVRVQRPEPSPGRSRDPGLVLLHDLRRLYLMTGDNLLLWDTLCCVAPVAGLRVLLDLAAVCRPGTVAQLTWARAALRGRAATALTGRGLHHRAALTVLNAVEHLDDPGEWLVPAVPVPEASSRRAAT